MERIKIYIIDLPYKIHGLTVYSFDEDGQSYFTILINAHDNATTQQRTYDHEIKHIDNYDFDSMLPADRLEGFRHII